MSQRPGQSDIREQQARGNGQPPALKGHDSVLRAIRTQGRTITVEKVSGEVRVGKLVGNDKFTLTVKTDDGIRRVIYKHDVSEFYAEEAPSVEKKGG